MGGFYRNCGFIVSQLFICQWRRTRSDKAKLEGRSSPAREVSHHVYWSCSRSQVFNRTATSSISSRTPNLQRRTWPLPQPFIFCKYEAWGHGVTIMVADRRRLETVGGISPCPSGPLSPLSHSATPDTRGREPARPHRCRLDFTTPGFFLLISRHSCWVTCPPFSLKLVHDRVIPIFLKNGFVWRDFCSESVRTWDKRIRRLRLRCYTQVLTDVS